MTKPKKTKKPKTSKNFKSKGQIKKITEKDVKMFHALRSVCYIEHEHYHDVLEINGDRMKKFVADGYLQEVRYRNPKTKRHRTAYALTEEGRKLAYDYTELKDFYVSISPFHDRKLADVYFGLDEDTRQTWKTEATLKEELRERMADDYELKQMWENKKISVSDGAYKVGDSYQLVEIYTKNYREHHKVQKEEYASAMGYELETYNA